MALWTPAEIATEGWFDAADAGTITLSGSAVTQWADKSGNARHMGDLSQRPTYETAGQNGLNVVALNNSAMSWPGVSLPADDWQFFFAHDQTNPTSSVYRYFFDSTLDRFVLASHYANTNKSAVFAGSWGTITLSPNVAGGQILHYSIAATTTQLRDGTQVATTGGYSQHPIGGTVRWFGSATALGNQLATGKMWEILVIKGAVSVADRQKIEGYLAHKWGLTANLPAAHPYKTAAPQVAVEITGTGSPVTAPITASGTAEREITSTGVATTASITATGQVARIVTGQGVVILGAITAAGVDVVPPVSASRTVNVSDQNRIAKVDAQDRTAKVDVQDRKAVA